MGRAELSVHVRMWPGPGDPVFLVHGIVSSRYLVPLGRALSATHRVVAPDAPGFGRSTRSPAPPTVAEMADAVVTAGVERSVVLGHSMGAQVAVELAARHPHLVAGLVLVGPTVDVEARSVGAQFRRWLVNAPREPVRFNGLVAYEIGEMGPAWMLGTFRRAVECPLEERLPDVRCPVLLARGEHDVISPRRWLEDLRAAVPDAPIVDIPDAAHTAVYTHPEAVAGLVGQV